MPPTPTLLQKLFNKKNGLVSPGKEFKEEAVFSWPLPEFNPSQIRLIVYQDCERRGRNVLFDSNAKRRTEDVSISLVGKVQHVYDSRQHLTKKYKIIIQKKKKLECKETKNHGLYHMILQ